jgi:hypothetical protein
VSRPDDDKTQTHAPLTSGTTVSHYRIIEKIGAGEGWRPKMKRNCGVVFTMLLLTAFMVNPAVLSARSNPPKDLDKFAGKVLRQFEVPGMAVAIVKDGEVVAARGYGIRDTAESTPVDAHTLFAIASDLPPKKWTLS